MSFHESRRATGEGPGSRNRRGVRILGLALALAATGLLPGGALSQSLFSSGGLGVPISARDARSRAMGGIRVGLLGPSLYPGDPGAALDLLLPVLAGTYQASTGSFSAPGGGGDLEGARFPYFAVAYPVENWGLVVLSFEGVLDQRWSAASEGVVPLGGESVPVEDRFVSDGGISAIRLAWNQRFSPEFAALFSIGTYTGESERTFRRSFPEGVASAPADPFVRTGRWRYTGATAEVGAVWDAAEFIRVGARLTWSGGVTAEPRDDTPGGEREFDFPLQVDVGASGILTSRLVAAIGVHYADWSGAGDDLLAGDAGGSWEVGAGVEWAGPRVGDQEFPIRIGYHRVDLPFFVDGAQPEESAFTFGVGGALAQVRENPLARLDFAVERGNRSGGGLEEDFWRSTLSLRLSTP